MKKPIALAIAGILTALVLVLMIGVGTTVARTMTLQQAPGVSSPIQADIASNSVTTKLTADHAAQIAQSAVPNSTLTMTPELVNLQGTAAYQVILNNAVVYIDANTGIVLYNSTNANSTLNNNSQRRSGEHSDSHEEDDDD